MIFDVYMALDLNLILLNILVSSNILQNCKYIVKCTKIINKTPPYR